MPVPARVLALVAAGFFVALAGCYEDNPNYCERDEKCAPGVCDRFTHRCVSGGNPSERTGGTGGARPAAGGAGGGGGDSTDGAPLIDMPGAEMSAAGGAGGAAPPPNDGGVETGPPRCTKDEDCPEGMKICGGDGMCTQCDDGKTQFCPVEKPFCSPAKTCVSCKDPTVTMMMCKGDTPHCADEGWCAGCLDSSHCGQPDKPICAVSPMNAAGDMRKSCTACTTSEACAAKNPMLPACNMAAGTCVECATSQDCKMADKPICDTKTNKCVPCSSDDQCAMRGDNGPGICLVEPDAKTGGRCATDAETIYVSRMPCSSSGKGDAAMPFCDPQKGADTLTKDRRLMVIRGGSYAGFRIDKTALNGAVVWVVGRRDGNMEPAINPGATQPGILVRTTTADVRLRGLTVRGAEDIGVLVENNATVRLNRMTVVDNYRGGISIRGGAGFDIANTVVEGNGKAAGVTGSAYGGIHIASAAGSGRPARIRASTIINNTGAGITCPPDLITPTGVLMLGNEPIGCRLPTFSRIGMDPGFGAAPYHLRMDAPCRNVLPTGDAPFDELDGDPRDADKDGKTDCGADEWKP